MAVTDLVNAADMKRVMEAFAAPDSFNHDKFFEMMGMKKHSKQLIRVFNLLDVNQDGFLDVNEAQSILKRFKDDARDLTDTETKEFFKIADTDGDGRISLDEWAALGD